MHDLIKTDISDFSDSFCSGFTLMEVLVAVMLLSLSLTLIMQNFSMGLKNISLSDSFTEAVHHARNIMDESLLTPNIVPGISSGVIDDTYKWERNVSEIPKPPGGKNTGMKEFEIRVKIMWNFGIIPKDFELVTLRMKKN